MKMRGQTVSPWLTPPLSHKKDNEHNEERNDYDQQQTANHNPHHFPDI